MTVYSAEGGEAVTVYYNEIQSYAATWLENLIAAGLVAPGIVDRRSICDVAPADVTGAMQAHFFAGIGVWSHALRLAGWPDDIPVWTGSCPCQPFSQAGAAQGFSDERHLWPVWARLVAECRPAVLFGEQVASKAGRVWLDVVRADLEAMGYAVGAADLCAAGIGAPHIRQRIFWVAYAYRGGCEVERIARGKRGAPGVESDRRGAPGEGIAAGATRGFWAPADWLPCRDGCWRPAEPGTFPLAYGPAGRVGRLRAYGNAVVAPLAAEFDCFANVA